MNKDLFKLNKCGRVCYDFPWENHKIPCPWPSTHRRVMIPYTAIELRNSRNGRRAHVQIVRNDNVRKVREVRFSV